MAPQRWKPETTPLSTSVDASDPAAPTVRVVGDLDFTTAEPLRVTLDDLLVGAPPVIVLDFAGLTFLDSTGLAVIVHAWREGHQGGTAIRLVRTPGFLDSILGITGVADLLARPPLADATDRSAASA